ncbi:hypothetical protein GS500_16155 [Rhodococcus hoagii]|nr:hypothetical protein [Prescottella equi]
MEPGEDFLAGTDAAGSGDGDGRVLPAEVVEFAVAGPDGGVGVLEEVHVEDAVAGGDAGLPASSVPSVTSRWRTSRMAALFVTGFGIV